MFIILLSFLFLTKR